MPDPTDTSPIEIDEHTQSAVEAISDSIHSLDGLLVMPSTLDGKDVWSLGRFVGDDTNDVYVLAIVINPDLLERLSSRGVDFLAYQCAGGQSLPQQPDVPVEDSK